MKQISTLLIVVLTMANSLLAQKKLSEGTIAYDIVINTGSAKPQAADFLDGATSTVYISGTKTRTDMVSSLGTQSTIMDASKGAVTILKEFGEKKYMIKLTPADWSDANKRYENVVFTQTNETKTVAGYTCKKAIGKLADGTTFTVWFTPDLVPENKDFQYATRSLPGLAMEYETNLGSLKVTYTVSKITLAAIPGSKFDLPKAGFRVLTYAESKGGQ